MYGKNAGTHWKKRLGGSQRWYGRFWRTQILLALLEFESRTVQEITRYSCQILTKLRPSRHILDTQIPNSMKIRPVGAEFHDVEGQT